eukprot:2174313-Amphidinium_carterae.1
MLIRSGPAPLGLRVIENDQRFTVQVKVQDTSDASFVLKARPDALIMPTPDVANSTNHSIDELVAQTILFVEVVSGNKSVEHAQLQLFTAMKSMAVHFQHNRLYGAVIDTHFSEASLTRFYGTSCESDGRVPVANLGIVARHLLGEHSHTR